MFPLLNCWHFFIVFDSSEKKDTCPGPILCQQKWFWSSSEVLLSDGHQWALIYDFLVNTAVDSNKTGLVIFLEICAIFLRLFLELLKELSQSFHEIARCGSLQQKIRNSLQITFEFSFSVVWCGLDFTYTIQGLLDVVLLGVQKRNEGSVVCNFKYAS